MSVLEALLGLQLVDTEIAQIEHRLAHLPEAEAARAADQRRTTILAELRKVGEELDRLAAVVEANETAVAEIRRQTDRLNGQLRTVIAPREAEALQHEIRVLAERASTIDDESIVAIEQSEALDAESARLEVEAKRAADESSAARVVLDEASATVASTLGDARTRRDALAGAIDASAVASYDKKRRDLAGVAVARLARTTCGGCHLDLSPSEVDAVKRLAVDERECPNCTRWLVV